MTISENQAVIERVLLMLRRGNAEQSLLDQAAAALRAGAAAAEAEGRDVRVPIAGVVVTLRRPNAPPRPRFWVRLVDQWSPF